MNTRARCPRCKIRLDTDRPPDRLCDGCVRDDAIAAERKHLPCPTCPWRKSSTIGGADIPGFSMEMMRDLRGTVGRGDAFRPIMACHYSKPSEEIPCRGYIAQEGISNLNVRMLAARDKIPAMEIVRACAELDLWPDFESMLDAYEEANDT